MRFIAVLGIATMIGIAILLSTDRRKIRWSILGWGLGLQVLLALIILKTQLGQQFFLMLNDVALAILDSTQAGASFVFGNLATFEPIEIQSTVQGSIQMLSGFAFLVLPTIIFFSSLMAMLYHAGLMQIVVRAIAWVMAKTMRISGPESLSCAANIFVGQTEAPLVIKPFLSKMSLSEITAIMAGGFATIAGGVLAAYVGLLGDNIPNIAGHLMAASVMSAPAALMMAKIFVPESGEVLSFDDIKGEMKKVDANIIDAAARGASDGMRLALNVATMLIAFLAIIALINTLLGWIGGLVGLTGLNLAMIFGYVLSPFAFLLGVPWADCKDVGNLIGIKIFINEFVAYGQLNEYAANMSEKGRLISTYALCGFANVGSIGIQIGGISALAPERRSDLARVAVRALLAGAFASFTTAAIAGMLL